MTDTISLNRDEAKNLLNEMQLNAGSLANMTRLYEEMHADYEGNGDCQRYIDPVSLGAFTRGIMALAQLVDRQVFELEGLFGRGEEKGAHE